MLIRVFLHAEFISAMKTVPNPTIFVKNAKLVLAIEKLSRISHKKYFLDK